MNQRLTSAADFLVNTEVDEPSGFIVKKETPVKESKKSVAAKIPAKKKKVELEEMVHVFMSWPEPMKREFDMLFLRDKELRKRGKNEVLLSWCREAMKSLPSR